MDGISFAHGKYIFYIMKMKQSVEKDQVKKCGNKERRQVKYEKRKWQGVMQL